MVREYSLAGIRGMNGVKYLHELWVRVDHGCLLGLLDLGIVGGLSFKHGKIVLVGETHI